MSAAVAVPAAPDSSPPGEVSPPPQTSPAGESFEIPGVELTAIAARVVGDLSPDELAAALSQIADRERGNRWWLGDLLAFSEGREHGVTYREWAARTGLDVDTLYNRASLAKAVPPSVRLPEDQLSWAKHRPVAALSEEHQGKWLNLAAEEGWSEGKLRHAIQTEGEAQEGSGGHGAFAGGADEFEDPLAGEVPCPRCEGRGRVPAAGVAE